MKVTVCQIDSRPHKIEQYFKGLVDHLAQHSSDFLLLPELGFSQWLPAEPQGDRQRWQEAVVEHETWIARFSELGVFGVLGTRPIVNNHGSHRNEAYLWSRANPNPVGIHQKYYIPNEECYWEHNWYDRGAKSFEVARLQETRIGAQICTEMWFFEWARHYASSLVDLLCVPRATPHGSIDKWLAGGQVAGRCAGAFCLSSNLIAPIGNGLDLGGLGFVTDPEGNILATTNDSDPFATVEVDLDLAKKAKSAHPCYVSE